MTGADIDIQDPSPGAVRSLPQYEVLAECLGDQTSVEDALESFCGPIERTFSETKDAQDLENRLWLAWRVVVASATYLPHTSGSKQKLVDFVLGMRQRPTLTVDGEPCIVQDCVVWKEFPVFGMAMRDAWNLTATAESPAEQKDQWININAWTATLVASSHAINLASPDFSLYGIWTIRTALEEPGPSAVTLAAAAVWFIYAAPTLRELSEAGKEFNGKLAKAGCLADGSWKGFNQQRWRWWGQQLESTRRKMSDEEEDEETVKLVTDALSAIEAIDEQFR